MSIKRLCEVDTTEFGDNRYPEERTPEFIGRLCETFPFLNCSGKWSSLVDSLREYIDDHVELDFLTPETAKFLPLEETSYVFSQCVESKINRPVIFALFERLFSFDSRKLAVTYACGESFIPTFYKFELAAAHPDVFDDETIISAFNGERTIVEPELLDAFGPERKGRLLRKFVERHFLEDFDYGSESAGNLLKTLSLEQVKELVEQGAEEERFYIDMVTEDTPVTDFLLEHFGVPRGTRIVTASKVLWLAEHKDEEWVRDFFEYGYVYSLFDQSSLLNKEQYLRMVRALVDHSGFTGDHLPYATAEERSLHSMLNYTVDIPEEEKPLVNKFEKFLQQRYSIESVEALAHLI